MPSPAEWPSLTPRPGTIAWSRAGDARVLLAAGYALLLQVSHPTVGAGVSEHSRFRTDPWGRLLRTLDYACTMVYGGPRAAGEMGRRIRAGHTRIAGTRPDGRRYRALEPDAYAWVHATLAEGILRAHERFGVAFTRAQREQLWEQWRTLGRLLGVRDRDLPEGWTAFNEYVERTIASRLEHTAAVDEVLEALACPAPPAAFERFPPAWTPARAQLGHVAVLATAGLLPPLLRRRFGVRWTRGDELELRLLGAALRAATPLMPASLRNTGPGYLRWRGEAIEREAMAGMGPSRASPRRTAIPSRDVR